MKGITLLAKGEMERDLYNKCIGIFLKINVVPK